MTREEVVKELRELAEIEEMYPLVPMVSTDVMAAAAGHLSRNWGGYGYKLGVEIAVIGGPAVIYCSHFDGSRFRFIVDHWGQCFDVPEAHDVTYKTALAWYVSQKEANDA